MSIDWSLAGTVILTGIVFVFLALVLLIGLVILMGKVVTRINQPKEAPQASAPPRPVVAPPRAVPAPAPASNEDETVAVIAAAVGAYMEQSAPGVPYAVTGISPSVGRVKDVRPVWGFAGMRQNTEPF